jgi:membrane-associated protease RseP (regulator of RpoE activity)
MLRSHFQFGRTIVGLALCAIAGGRALGQQTINHTLLDELNRQSQALYGVVSQGVVRVQLPTTEPSTQPASTMEASATAPVEDPLARWNEKLSPEVRDRLRQSLPAGALYVAEIVPVPGPTVMTPSDRPMSSGSASLKSAKIIVFTPNVLGVVIDAQGHALLPMFVPRENIGGKPLTVLLCDGTVTQAKFIGSDRQTNLTVVQLLHGVVRPLPFSVQPPPEGALVMVMSMDPAATHLGLWTRWANNWGLVIRTDGTVAGFSQRGGFLSGVACAPVVQQLIQQGHVDRPRLGVVIRVVAQNDPLRQFDTVLGQTPAIRIWQVISNSPAQKAGLQAGDLILALAGQPVGDTPSFAAAIASLHGPTPMRILRQDQIISVTVDLESQPSN